MLMGGSDLALRTAASASVCRERKDGWRDKGGGHRRQVQVA